MSGETKSKEEESSRPEDLAESEQTKEPVTSLGEEQVEAADQEPAAESATLSEPEVEEPVSGDEEGPEESASAPVESGPEAAGTTDEALEPSAEPSAPTDPEKATIEAAEPGSLAARRRKRKKKSPLRILLSTVHRMVAFGLLVVIASVMVNWVIAIRITIPRALAGGSLFDGGVFDRILAGLVSQIGILVVLPVLAWCVAWVLEDRPFRFAIGAAVFVELWSLAISVMSGGVGSLIWEPVHMLARYFFVLVAGILGGLAYIHGRRVADRFFPPEDKKPDRPAPSS